jgi:hypothetical protein
MELGDEKCLYLDQRLDHVHCLALLNLLPVLNLQSLLSNVWLFSNISKYNILFYFLHYSHVSAKCIFCFPFDLMCLLFHLFIKIFLSYVVRAY